MKTISTLIIIFSFLFVNAQVTDVLDFKKAKRLMSLDSYQEALPILKKLKGVYSENYNLDYLIGKCYLEQQYEKELSIPYFELAAKHIEKDIYKNNFKNLSSPIKTNLFLAKSYLLNYDLKKSIASASVIIDDSDDDKLITQARQIKKNAEVAQELMLSPIKINIERLNINSKYSDHSALLNVEETQVIFTSGRKGSTGGLRTNEGGYYEDIYISFKKDGVWSTPENMGENINTERHDAAVALSTDASTLIIFRDDFGVGNLYISVKDSTGWTKAKKLTKNINSKSNETHAAFSHDGQRLYFVSDIKEGFGGKDIYFSNKLPDGTWGYPQNLGSLINTEFDEEGVYVHPDGQKLYFSSKGHRNMGAFDLFYCNLIGDSAWSAPINIGYPINSTANDVFAVFSADNKRAYYSANKKEGLGSYDIYLVDLMSLTERNNTILKGYLIDSDKQIVTNKTIKITDEEGLVIGRYKANSNGLYTIVLQQNTSYKISVKGLELDSSELIVPDKTAYFITHKALIIKAIAKSK